MRGFLKKSRKTDAVAAGCAGEFLKGWGPRPAFALLIGLMLLTGCAKTVTQQAESEQVRQQAAAQESTLRQQRERSQKAQHELQEARFYAKTCTEKIADLERSLKQIGLTLAQLEQTLAQSRDELANLEEGSSKQQLQEALQQRQVREQALSEARNTLEHATNNLNKLEQDRMSCEQKLHPLREKASELSLKEQEARLQFEQWAEQLNGVDEAALQPLLEAGNAKPAALQNELNRLNGDIEALGAVNLAALEELQAAQERKSYLDAQAKDLNDAMATLEDAIRRIDKESRELLMVTYIYYVTYFIIYNILAHSASGNNHWFSKQHSLYYNHPKGFILT